MKRVKKFNAMLLALLATVIVGFAMTACAQRGSDVGSMTSSVRDMPAPKADAARGIDADMSAEEMMEAGFYNYYAAPYVVSENYSTNLTNLPVLGTVNVQYIDGYKIRKGVYNDASLLSSQAYHLVIAAGAVRSSRRIEEAVVNNGSISYRTMTGSALQYNDDTGMLKVPSDGKFTYVDYGTDLDKYNAEICNDPLKVFTYNIFDTSENALANGCVQSATQPVYDSEAGIYTFSVVFNNEVVTKDYIRLLELNLDKQGGKDVRYTSLEMDFEIWADGHIKSIAILEKYDFTLGMPMSNEYEAEVYFAYDEQDCGYIMSDYVDAFDNNIAITRNNELYDYSAENVEVNVMSPAEIAGVVIGVLALSAIIIIVVAAVLKKQHKKKLADEEAKAAAASEREVFGDNEE